MYNDLIISMRSIANMLDCQENENLPLVQSIIRKFKAAASAIEDLQTVLEQEKKARDAVIRDLRSCDIDCNFCIHAGKVIGCDLDCEHCAEDCVCAKCRNNNLWQWRGGQAKGGRR